MWRYKLVICLVALIPIVLPQITYSSESDQFITLVNPVRISQYTQNPIISLNNQYSIISQENLPASWLFTYDAFTFPGMTEAIKAMNSNQDIGLFFEVTENYAKKFEVEYNKSDSWHRSNSIFLSGYSQQDRIKLIDGVFEEFKKMFGYYPTSVGAWWIDSFSLDYMQEKYKINANLVVADQLGTDGYTVWGQFWGIPYYPSKNHSAKPAQSIENKINVVNIQWAPRDPLNGYRSPNESRSSLFSTQDYYTINLGDAYFEKLIKLFSDADKNEFGQITFGLEGDFEADAYGPNTQYEKYIKIAGKFSKTENYTITNMKQFGDWYMKKYPQISPSYILESDDLLGKKQRSFWYQNPNYRIGLIHDNEKKTLKIIDLRVYQANFKEPYFLSQNSQLDLYINLPSLIDTVIDEQRYIKFDDVQSAILIKEGNHSKININNLGEISFLENEIVFKNLNSSSLPDFFAKNSLVTFNKTTESFALKFNREFPVSENGYIFRDLSIEASYFLRTKKAALLLVLILVISVVLVLIKLGKYKKIIIFCYFLLVFSGLVFWYFRNSQNFFVSQSEIEALLKLKTYPQGNILVINHDCLHCNSQTGYPLAAFANKRSYISKFADKSLTNDNELIEIYSDNLMIPTKLTREQVKQYLADSGANYIYLVRHEDYSEKLPYSPGDLGVEQLYFNADAEIWRVKE